MTGYRVCLIGIWLSLSCPAVHAANSVTVESKSVAPGGTSVSVGIYVTNDVSIQGLVIPLEIRSVLGSGFITNNLGISRQNRLTSNLQGHTTNSILPAKDNTTWYKCDGSGYKTRGSADYSSPEGYLFAALSVANPMAAGADGSGQPSLHITFDVTNQYGMFVIDTTCVTPDNHLAFYTSGRELITPLFTIGRIALCTSCPCWENPQCDGAVADVFDVINVINVAFRGVSSDSDEGCLVQRQDVNADGEVNVLDVTRIINLAFRGGGHSANPCP